MSRKILFMAAKEAKTAWGVEEFKTEKSSFDPGQEQVIGRGLYRNVRISVQMLDRIIVLGLGILVLLIVFGSTNGGYTITYNAQGGSEVPSVKAFYGDILQMEAQSIPQRQGYSFAGWYLDENCTLPAASRQEIQGDTVFYAAWKPQ